MEKDVLNCLIKSRLFQGLSEDQILSICSAVTITEREYIKNQVIVNQGEPIKKIGILKKGNGISVKYHFDGNAQILRIYGEGEIVLLDAVNTALSTSPATLMSHSDCSMIFIPYGEILKAKSIMMEVKSLVMANCSEILSNELIRFMYKIDVLSKRTLRERILTYLSILKERTGSNIFDIGMNQEQFAQYLCVNRSVLSSELNLMKNSGIIEYKGSHFKICD